MNSARARVKFGVPEAVALFRSSPRQSPTAVPGAANGDEVLGSLLRLSDKLDSTSELGEFLDALVIEAIRVVQADSGCSGIRTHDGMECRRYFHRGRGLDLHYCWPPMHGLPGWVLVHRAPYLTNDASSDPQFAKDLCTTFGVKAALCTPILDRHGEAIGFIEVHNKVDGSEFGDADVEKLLALSRLACVAIQNIAALGALRDAQDGYRAVREELTAQVAALTRLHELAMRLSGPLELPAALDAILRTAVELNGASLGLLSIYDAESGKLSAAASVGFDAGALSEIGHLEPRSGAACGAAFTSKTRIVVHDVQTDPRFECYRELALRAGIRSVHSTPILTKSDEILGVLSVYYTVCHQPTQRELQLTDMCAGQAAQGIESARNQDALRESEQRYRQLVQRLPAAIYATDARGRVTLYNEAAVALWGRAPEIGKDEWCGSHKMYWPDGSELPLSRCPMAIALQEGRSLNGVEAVVERPDGARRNVLAYPQITRSAEGAVTGATNVLVDITDRKEAETQLASLKDQLAADLDGMRRLHAISTRLMQHGELNPLLAEIVDAAIAITGADKGKIQLLDRTGRLRIEAQRGFDQAFLDFFNRESDRHAVSAAALRTGVRIIVEDIADSPLLAGTHALAVIQAAGVRGLQSTPLISRSGRIQGMFSTHYREPWKPTEREVQLLDMLARQAADLIERAQEEARMREAQKLESVGLLAGGVAHDFNNILVGVLGNASLAGDMLPPGSPVKPLLKDIETASERAAHLTRQMLAYAGKGQFVLEPVDLSDVVRETIGLVQLSISKKISLHLDLADGLPTMRADRSQAQQVVMNLVLNGAEAIGDAPGDVSVRTFMHELERDDETNGFTDRELPPGTYVGIEVRDTGCGMEEATRQRIFDPFFTTKFTGRGLGLAAVAGIVRGHKGTIRVTSAPGEGSTFLVLFPATGAPLSRGARQSAAPEPEVRGREGILIVDDEEVVLRTAKLALETRGYTVHLANNGAAAVAALRRAPSRIDVVLLDVSMPGMSGSETLSELQRIKPDVRVLISSGYSESEALRQFPGKRIAGFVQKPYTAARLAEHVKRVLAG